MKKVFREHKSKALIYLVKNSKEMELMDKKGALAYLVARGEVPDTFPLSTFEDLAKDAGVNFKPTPLRPEYKGAGNNNRILAAALLEINSALGNESKYKSQLIRIAGHYAKGWE